MSEFVFVNRFGDSVVCRCGNDESWDGFYNCRSATDPTNVEDGYAGEWDGKHVACDRCRRILDMTTHRSNDTGTVLGYPEWRDYCYVVDVVQKPDITPDIPGYERLVRMG